MKHRDLLTGEHRSTAITRAEAIFIATRLATITAWGAYEPLTASIDAKAHVNVIVAHIVHLKCRYAAENGFGLNAEAVTFRCAGVFKAGEAADIAICAGVFVAVWIARHHGLGLTGRSGGWTAVEVTRTAFIAHDSA
mgnify:CR=1 FL=1